jgi:hypothetical protein
MAFAIRFIAVGLLQLHRAWGCAAKALSSCTGGCRSAHHGAAQQSVPLSASVGPPPAVLPASAVRRICSTTRSATWTPGPRSPPTSTTIVNPPLHMSIINHYHSAIQWRVTTYINDRPQLHGASCSFKQAVFNSPPQVCCYVNFRLGRKQAVFNKL